MPRSTHTTDPNAHLPAFLLRIYDATEELHGDPTIRGFTAGGYGRQLSMSVDDFIPKQITTGFCSHVRAQSYVPPHSSLSLHNPTQHYPQTLDLDIHQLAMGSLRMRTPLCLSQQAAVQPPHRVHL
jgi:hypothetical protein